MPVSGTMTTIAASAMADDPVHTEAADIVAETPAAVAGESGGVPSDVGRSPWGKGDALALAVVVLAALAIRGLYVYQQRSAPDFGHPVGDAEFFHQWGGTFAEGQRFTDGPYYRAPLYPWVLGTVYKLLGVGPLAPRVVQVVLGSLTCGLLFAIGRVLFGRVVGVLAGLAAASYWILVYFTGELLIPTLVTFLDVLLVLTLLGAHQRRCLGLWGLSGLILGLSGIARPNVLLFAPVVLIWIVMIGDHRRGRILSGAVFTAGCLIPVLPVTIRNYVVGDDLVLISSQGGVNLYIGNNPQADGFNVVLPGTRPHWRDTYLDQIAIAERAEGRALKPSEVSGYYLRQTCKFVADSPGTALGLLFSKLKYFWNGYEFANNKDIYDYTGRYTPIVRYLPLGFGVIAPLGLLGLVLHWPRRRELFPLWGFVVVYTVSVVLFFVSARFRVPVIPLLMVYGAAACVWLVQTAGRRRWRPLIEAAVFVALLAVFCNVRQAWSSMPGSWNLTTAALLAQQGKLDEAIAEYHQAIAQFPGNHEAHGDLASLYLIKGNVAAAEQSARRAVELNPDYAKGHDMLGTALARQGRLDEAIGHFRRSVELVPHSAWARQHLGQALLRRGELARAAEHLGRAAELDPDRADTQASLGRLAAMRGDSAAAIEHFDRSASLEPANPRVYDQWARVLQSQSRTAEAVAVLRDGLREVPDNDALTIRLAGLLLATPDPDIRDPDEAVRLAEGVCQRDGGNNPRTLHTLAAAYAVAGRCDDAVREARRAVPLAEQAGLTPIVRQLEALIARCSTGQLGDVEG